MHSYLPESDKNLPTPGIGEPGVLGIIPGWTEVGRPDLSGGPPGAERGTRSVGTATVDDLITCCRSLFIHIIQHKCRVLLLLVGVCFCMCVCDLTHRCASWSQQGSSPTSSHCHWCSHGSQCHPSLSDLCEECMALLPLTLFKCSSSVKESMYRFCLQRLITSGCDTMRCRTLSWSWSHLRTHWCYINLLQPKGK